MSNQTPFSKLNPFLPLPDMSGKNPFAPLDSAVPDGAPEGSYTYALVQSAPAVPAEEFETAATAAEIVLRWGASTLHVAHLTPPRAFHVGEASDAAPVDFCLPAEKLGVARLPVLRTAADGAAFVVIPPGAKGTATLGAEVLKLSDLAASGRAEASTLVSGAFELPLKASTKVRFEIGGIEIDVASVNAGRRVAGRFSLDRGGLPFQAVSLALHLGLLGAAAVFMPPVALAAEDSISNDQIHSLQVALSASAEREVEQPKASDPGGPAGPSQSAPESSPSSSKNGPSGPVAHGKGGAIGPDRNSPVAQLSRDETIAMARGFGMIGLLNADPNGPPSASPWGGYSLTGDPTKQTLWDGGSLESGGSNGLTLTGIGEDGGPGGGYRLDRIATMGLPTGLDLFGGRPGRDRGHKGADLTMRTADTHTTGRIPMEIIRRAVHQSFGRFRLCYENGLRTNPSLAGRVSVRFVIGRDGAVMSAANGGSDLPDASVVSCVVTAFRGLQFPQIEDAGVATVVYPLVFSPTK